MLVFEWAFFVVLLLFCLLCGTAGVLCAACCVRPGCSVRPPSTAHDLPSSVWSLCVPVGGGPPARRPRRRACLGRPGRCVCRWAAARPLAVRAAGPASVGLAAVCAGGRRPAREIATREPDGSEWSISRPALALPPPTGTATRPCGPSGALHTCGAGSLFGSSTRRLEARPGPATAHGRRSQATHPGLGPTSAKKCALLASMKEISPQQGTPPLGSRL